MSAYSDWKCGAISTSEFKSAMAYECRGDNYIGPDGDEILIDEGDAYDILCKMEFILGGYDGAKDMKVDDDSIYDAIRVAMKCMERLWRLERKLNEAKK